MASRSRVQGAIAFKGHFAVLVVVAVALAVGCNVGELRGGGRPVAVEAADEAASEVFAGVEQALEGDGARAGAVVEEDRDAAAFVEVNEIRMRGVDRGGGGFGPGFGCGLWVLGCGFGDRGDGAFLVDGGAVESSVELGGLGVGGAAASYRSGGFFSGGGGGGASGDFLVAQLAHAGALAGGEDGELDALLRHQVEDGAGDGGFSEPHALGATAEAVLEVGDAPADLRAGVALAGERHDHVVVDLRDGGAMAAIAFGAGAIGVLDHAIGAGREVRQPTQQRRPEVEADARVVVEDADDFVRLVGDAGGAVGGVALGGNALVPVVVGRGGVLHFDGFEPRVFARRLIKMAVDADVMLRLDVGVGCAGFRHISFIIYWKGGMRLVRTSLMCKVLRDEWGTQGPLLASAAVGSF